MSASGPPLCRICQKEHWMREPHILPANAPSEKRAKRPKIIATYTPPTPAAKAENQTKADKVTPGKRKTAPKKKAKKGKKKCK